MISQITKRTHLIIGICILFVLTFLCTGNLVIEADDPPLFTIDDCNCLELPIKIDRERCTHYPLDSHAAELICKYRQGDTSADTFKEMGLHIWYYRDSEDATRNLNSLAKSMEEITEDWQDEHWVEVISADTTNTKAYHFRKEIPRHDTVQTSSPFGHSGKYSGESADVPYYFGAEVILYNSHYLLRVSGGGDGFGSDDAFKSAFNILEQHAKSVVDSQSGIDKGAKPEEIKDEYEGNYYIYPGVLNDVEPGEKISFSVITEAGDRISDEKMREFSWEIGACKSVSDWLAASQVSGGSWITIGEIDDETGEFIGRNIGTCQVYLYQNGNKVDNVEVKVVCPENIPGDLDAVLDLYRSEIPWGPILEDVRAGKAPICFSKIAPGAANNMICSARPTEAWLVSWVKELDQTWDEWVKRYGDFTCGGYQKQVMIFLHNRIRADGQNCTLLNGYRFIPIRGEFGAHHAVVVYPEDGNWETDGIVLDPWPTQKPAVSLIDEWSAKFWPAQEEAFEADRKVYSTEGGRYTGDAHCPVNILITDDLGRRSGVLSDGSRINEIPDAFIISIPDDEGGSEWYYDLNSSISDAYQFQITGIGDGSFSLISADNMEGLIRYFEDQPILQGQTVNMTIDNAALRAPLVLPDGTAVEPQVFEFDLDLDSDSGGGLHPVMVIAPIVIAGAFAIGAFVYIRRKRIRMAPIYAHTAPSTTGEKHTAQTVSTPSVAYCLKCGAANGEGAAFCGKCGLSLQP